MKTLFAIAVALLLTAVTASAQVPRAPQAPGWTAPSSAEAISPGLFRVELLQTVVSRPGVLEFTSVDHSATDAGSPVITSYDVTVFLVGSTTPAKPAVNIGKPPLSGSVVSYTSFNTVWAGLPAGQYNVTVTAKGSGGAATSPLSTTPFSVDPRAPAAPGVPTFRQ